VCETLSFLNAGGMFLSNTLPSCDVIEGRAPDDVTHRVHGFRRILLKEMYSSQLCSTAREGAIWCKGLHERLIYFNRSAMQQWRAIRTQNNGASDASTLLGRLLRVRGCCCAAGGKLCMNHEDIQTCRSQCSHSSVFPVEMRTAL
jgi:hypothetical protein